MIRLGISRRLTSAIKDRLLRTGSEFSSRGLSDLKGIIRKSLSICGILDGRYTYVGPRKVQIDITNRCNNNCLYCWARSPFLGEKRANKQWESYELPLDLIKRLIDDLHSLGTEDIHISGGGEPFIHPRIMDIIEYIKQKDMSCEITTNFTLVTEDIAKKIIELGVDSITISLWAGTAQTYEKLHPNRTEEMFYQVIETVKLISSIKKRKNKSRPLISLCNIISNINYREIEKMIDLAEDTEVELYFFGVMDPVLGYTDKLLLSERERQELIHRLSLLRPRMEKLALRRNVRVGELDEFMRRISSKKASLGRYDEEEVTKIPCYAGWVFSRITADGNVNFCLKADKYPVDNLYKKNFREIWLSKDYELLRHQMLSGNGKSDTHFRCNTTCDNLFENKDVSDKINSLSSWQKFLIKVTGAVYRARLNLYP